MCKSCNYINKGSETSATIINTFVGCIKLKMGVVKNPKIKGHEVNKCFKYKYFL